MKPYPSGSARLVLLASLAVFLASCVTTNPLQWGQSSTEAGAPGSADGAAGASRSGPAPLTPAEKQLREDEQRFYSTMMGGAFVGALAGAGVGVAGCHLAGYRDARLRNCIAASTVTGGILGGVDGYVTAKREAAGRNELRALQATISDVRQDNEKLKSFISNSDRVLAEGRGRLADLNKDLAQRKLTAAQAEEARQREERNVASMTKALENAKQSRANYIAAAKQFSADPKTKRDLDAEISRMNTQIAQLERNVSEYNKALAVSRA
jgi:hypothetical protein